MIIKKTFLKLPFLLLILYSCNRKFVNGVRQEERLSSFASIAADSVFYKKTAPGTYWPEQLNIRFLYNSLFGLDQTSVSLQKQEDCKIFIAQPTVIWAQQISEPVILYPGEKINIEATESGNVRFVSPDRKRARELHGFTELATLIYGQYLNSISNAQCSTLQTAFSLLRRDDSVRRQLNSGEELIKKKIDSLSNVYDISSGFKTEMMNYLSARVFALKVEYFWLTRKCPVIGNMPENRYDELISGANAIRSHAELKYYYNSLRDLLKILTNNKGQISGVFDRASLQLSLSEVNSNFNGLAKDFLAAVVLYAGLRNKVIGPDSLEAYADVECKDKTYRLVLKEMARSSNVSEKYADTDGDKFILPFASKTSLSEDDLLDRYKGKLVLVDFWSTWCIPCRREVPLVRELKRHYLGKDIVFLTISIDKEQLPLKKADSIEKAPPEENFVMKSSSSGFVFKGRLIEAIPRYFLLGKDGSVINDNAPSPDTAAFALKELIDKYLYQGAAGH